MFLSVEQNLVRRANDPTKKKVNKNFVWFVVSRCQEPIGSDRGGEKNLLRICDEKSYVEREKKTLKDHDGAFGLGAKWKG